MSGLRVMVVGAGNVGSRLVELVARLPGVGELTVVDRDAYEPSNLLSQAVEPGDVGQAKAVVQAWRAGRARAGLETHAVTVDVTEAPLGLFAGQDVLLLATDSRVSRQCAIAAAWRMGGTRLVLDGGIRADGHLARIMRYEPHGDGPCYECGWGDAEYAALEATHPCDPRDRETPATGAPGALGAVAAGLLALELTRFTENDPTQLPAGGQLVLGLDRGVVHHSRRLRSARCRFDHAVWPEMPTVTSDMPLGDLFGRAALEAGSDVELSVAHTSLTDVECPRCDGSRRALVRVRPEAPPRCGCGSPLAARGPRTGSRTLADFCESGRAAPLGAMGLLGGDVLVFRSAAGAVRRFLVDPADGAPGG